MGTASTIGQDGDRPVHPRPARARQALPRGRAYINGPDRRPGDDACPYTASHWWFLQCNYAELACNHRSRCAGSTGCPTLSSLWCRTPPAAPRRPDPGSTETPEESEEMSEEFKQGDRVTWKSHGGNAEARCNARSPRIPSWRAGR